MDLVHSRPIAQIIVVTAIAALSTSACADADAEPAESAGQPSPTTTTVPLPVTTARSTTTASVETSTTPSSAAEPTVPAEPIPLRDSLQLTAGWTYQTRNFDAPFEWTMPADDGLGRWQALFETSNYVVVTLNLADKQSPETVREEPGFVVTAMPPDMSVDDSVALWTAYAEGQDTFTAERTTGAFLGAETTVVSGTYELDRPGQGASFLRLTDSLTTPIPPGERRYLSYLVPVGDRTVMIMINGHAVDFDLLVTLAGQMLDSLEFL